MNKQSLYGDYHGKEVRDACLKIIGNAGHINQDDLDVLKFLSTKGSFEKKKVKLISNKSRVIPNVDKKDIERYTYP